MRLVDNRVFYLRRGVGDKPADDGEEGARRAEVASLFL